MKNFIKSYLIAFVLLLIIDGIWLAVMSNLFYSKQLATIMSPNALLLPALLFYVVYITALVIFVVLPSMQNNYSLIKVFLLGLLLGFAAYGTYDLTNQATIINWPWIVTVVDLAWGSLLTAIIGLITTVATRSRNLE